MRGLSGKRVIVTGGGSGIGRAVCERFGEEGAEIAIFDMSEDGAKETVRLITEAGGKAQAFKVDITDRAQVDKAVAEFEAGGPVDVLVNNAGIGGAPGFTTRRTPNVDDWQATFDVNVYGIVNGIQSVEKYMIDRGYGKIVNIASVAGRVGRPGFASYGASKAAAINVSQAWAFKLAPHGVNVNAVCPGLIWTPLWQSIGEWKSSTDEEQTVHIGLPDPTYRRT